MRTNLVETIVGAMVIGIALVFFGFAYKTAGLGSDRGGYHIKARFEGVNGVTSGTDVRMSGIKVGTVVDLSLDEKTYEAVLTLNVKPSLKLPEDSSIKIASEGLLGGNFVSIEVGGSDVMLKEGDEVFNTQSSVSLLDIIGQVVFGKSDSNNQTDKKSE